MDSQALDQQEIIMCKWAYEDPNPKALSRETEEEKLKLVQAHKQKEKYDIFILQLDDNRIKILMGGRRLVGIK